MAYRRRVRPRTFRRRAPAMRSKRTRRPVRRTRRPRKVAGMLDYQRSIALKGRGFPSTMWMHMPFTYSGYLTIPDGDFAGIRNIGFYPNSLYDPVIGLSTTMPYWFDQVAALGYRTYTVYGAKITVKLLNDSALISRVGTIVTPYYVGVTEPFSVTTELNNAVGLRNDLIIRDIGGNGAKPISYIKRYIDIARINGITKRQLLSDPTYQGTIAPSPFGTAPQKLTKFWLSLAIPPWYPDGSEARTLGFTVSIKFYIRLNNHQFTTVPYSTHLEGGAEPLQEAYPDGQEMDYGPAGPAG